MGETGKADGDETDLLAARTISAGELAAGNREGPEASILCFGIVWHPDVRRVGAVAPLHFSGAGHAELSRLTPSFNDWDSPLTDQFVSRSPIVLRRMSADEFEITPPGGRMAVEVNGRPLVAATRFSMLELGHEIILKLGNSVVLALFDAPAATHGRRWAATGELLGISQSIVEVRMSIERVAASRLPVLILGETGTGKELAARAIHAASDRAHHPMVSINMAALAPSLAPAELFGARRGAFTGAVADSAGLFEQASGGTLFLDEIGDTPAEVQPMLLRALEAGEVQRVGETRPRAVDVRVIAATDRALHEAGREAAFNRPLLQRLAGIEITMPPLRERRVDIGLLVRHFLADESDGLPRLAPGRALAERVCAFALAPWPGNVRELFNAVRRLRLGDSAFAIRQPYASRPPRPAATPRGRRPSSSNRGYRDPLEIGEEELLAALEASKWVIKGAADALNISRTSLYELMARSEAVNSIEELSDQQIHTTLRTVEGGLDRWASHLRVGRDALRKRILQLARD
ncbi:sigma 54-interacting transcriptional regulator [Erythrobacter sp.]|uniref:sigma-54-dependent transcriptional regulator n=1 Tax=Erythrobacter sp. TaxID=1042 RepID=UPI00311F062C